MEELSKPPSPNSNASLLKATSITSIALLIGYFFSFLKASTVAYYLGVGWQMDVFLWSYALIDLIAMSISGPLDGAFIPIYLDIEKGHNNEYLKFVGTVLSFVITLLGLSLLGLVLLTPDISRFAFGLAGIEQTKLASVLLWVMAPRILFVGPWSVYSLVLNARRSFFLPTITNIMQAVFVIIFILFFNPKFAIYSNAAGVAFGTIIQTLILFFYLRKLNLNFHLSYDFKSPSFIRFLKLFYPLVITRILILSLPVIDRTLASNLAQGSISALGYAQTLMQMSILLLLSALQKTILPFFTNAFISQGLNALANLFTKTIKLVLSVFLPLTILLIVLREPLIKIVFERGLFDSAATKLTEEPFLMYLFGVVPTAITFICAYTFLAVQDVRTNALVGSIFLFFVKVCLNPILIQTIGYSGLALSTSIAYLITGSVMISILWRRKVFLFSKSFMSSIIRGGIILPLILYVGTTITYQIFYGNIYTELISVGIVGLLIYYLFGTILHLEEISSINNFFQNSYKKWCNFAHLSH